MNLSSKSTHIINYFERLCCITLLLIEERQEANVEPLQPSILALTSQRDRGRRGEVLEPVRAIRGAQTSRRTWHTHITLHMVTGDEVISCLTLCLHTSVMIRIGVLGMVTS